MMANLKALLHPVRAVKDAVDWLRSSVTEIQEKEEEDEDEGEEKKEEDQEDDADKDDAADEEDENELVRGVTCTPQVRDKMFARLRRTAVVAVFSSFSTIVLIFMKLSGSSVSENLEYWEMMIPLIPAFLFSTSTMLSVLPENAIKSCTSACRQNPLNPKLWARFTLALIVATAVLAGLKGAGKTAVADELVDHDASIDDPGVLVLRRHFRCCSCILIGGVLPNVQKILPAKLWARFTFLR